MAASKSNNFDKGCYAAQRLQMMRSAPGQVARPSLRDPQPPPQFTENSSAKAKHMVNSSRAVDGAPPLISPQLERRATRPRIMPSTWRLKIEIPNETTRSSVHATSTGEEKLKGAVLTSLTAIALVGLGLIRADPLSVGENQNGPEVVNESYHDTSLPVREYPSEFAAVVPAFRVQPLHRRALPSEAAVEQRDEAEQLFTLPAVSATISHNFDGMPDSANGSFVTVPSDSNLSVGATQVVEVINTAYQVFNKSTGASVQAPKQISSIFTGVAGMCGQGTSGPYTDPIVLYDKKAGRWFISIIASNAGFTTGIECIAVSSSSNATGTYHRYVFSFGTNVFNDYDKFGVWPDAYYGSYNLFSRSFLGAKACAYQRSAMLAGTTAKAICFTNTNEFSFLLSDLDGATAPPAGEPNFFVDLFSTTSLHEFKFHVDFVIPNNSKFTGPVTIPVKSFTPACGFLTTVCVPQAGVSDQLDTLSDRLMFRLAYRNFGTHESLAVNHAVKGSIAPAGVRWYEIRNPNGAPPTVFQSGTLAGGSASLWMGSVAMDKVGDMALGFSESSSLIHPKIAFTGRMPSDPVATMEGITTIFAGNGSQTGKNSDRWGDYTGMAIDPSDDCTFWYVDQYIPSNGVFNFHTRLASFKFSTCL